MIHVLIGIPGSGKTTYSKILKEQLGCDIVSSDGLRNLHPDWDEPLIWDEVYNLCSRALKNNVDIIFDATNVTPKVRLRFKTEVEKRGAIVDMAAYFFDTPWTECQQRVIKRNTMPSERYLPPEVVESYGKTIIMPELDEGFNFIKVIRNGIVVAEITK